MIADDAIPSRAGEAEEVPRILTGYQNLLTYLPR